MLARLTRTRQGGGQVILDVNSVDALRATIPTARDLELGDRGRIILTGPGLGIAADISGAEVAWRRIFGAYGFSIADIHGEGLSEAVIDWYVPVPLATTAQANMALIPALTLVAALLAVLLFLGWLLVGRIQVLLFGKGGEGPGLLTPLMLVLGVVLIASLAGGARRRRA